MKKIVFVIQNACVLAVVLELIFCLVAFFANTVKRNITPTTVLTLIIFSFIISAAFLIFDIKKIPFIFGVFANYCIACLAFGLCILLPLPKDFTGAQIVVAMFAFSVIYIPFSVVILRIKKRSGKKSSV